MSQRVCTNKEAFTHRGLHTDTNNQPIINPSNVPTTQAKSYATVTMINSFPTKEQAILVDAIGNTTMKDNVLAIAEVTGSEAVRFAFRISNGCICIYLDRKTTVQDFVTNYRTITINNV